MLAICQTVLYRNSDVPAAVFTQTLPDGRQAVIQARIFQKKAGSVMNPAFQGEKSLIGCNDTFGYLFLNFLLNPKRPNRPEPKRSMVAGSGTVAHVPSTVRIGLSLIPFSSLPSLTV